MVKLPSIPRTIPLRGVFCIQVLLIAGVFTCIIVLFNQRFAESTEREVTLRMDATLAFAKERILLPFSEGHVAAEGAADMLTSDPAQTLRMADSPMFSVGDARFARYATSMLFGNASSAFQRRERTAGTGAYVVKYVGDGAGGIESDLINAGGGAEKGIKTYIQAITQVTESRGGIVDPADGLPYLNAFAMSSDLSNPMMLAAKMVNGQLAVHVTGPNGVGPPRPVRGLTDAEYASQFGMGLVNYSTLSCPRLWGTARGSSAFGRCTRWLSCLSTPAAALAIQHRPLLLPTALPIQSFSNAAGFASAMRGLSPQQ